MPSPRPRARRAAIPVALLTAAGLLVGTPALAGTPDLLATPQAPVVTDVIVRWADGVGEADKQAVRRAGGLRPGDPLTSISAEVTAVPAGQTAAALARRLSADPRVVWAEPDLVLRASSDDPGFGLLWGLQNTGQTINGVPGVPGVDIRAEQAARASAGQPGPQVVVAVVDQGVDISHPDLVDRLWRNPRETVNGRDDDGNGFVDDVHGWDFVRNAPVSAAAGTAHGTHVAGTVGATRDNRIGVAGVTARAQIMPVTFLDGDGMGTTSDAVRAIAYAGAQGARVINASWGGVARSAESVRPLREAIAASRTLVVAAAGNSGADNDSSLTAEFPASFDLPNVLAVAAVDNRGRLASFSNTGARTVDVGAPGVGIVSTAPAGAYTGQSGTSMAAPHAAGVAALVRSLRPDLTAGQTGDLVARTSRPLASLQGATTSGGMVDAQAAVAEALRTRPERRLACPAGVPSSGFADVAGNTHRAAIDCGVWYDLIRGRTASTFAPAEPVTRGQIATLLAGLVRQAGALPASTPDYFTDDAGPHETSINQLRHLGVLSGVAPGLYAPNRPVTRGQIATLLVGVQERLTGQALPAGGTPFTDVAMDTHRESIGKAFAAELVRGATTTTFAPQATTRRDQSAALLTRGLQRLLDVGRVDPDRP